MISPNLRQTLDRIGPLLDKSVASAILERWDSLPLPEAALGRLEDLVLHYGMIRGAAAPALHRKGLVVFCADHGLVEEGVTGGLADATARDVAQFVRGGAPAAILCRQYAIDPVIVNIGLAGPHPPGGLDVRCCEGSLNITRSPALTPEQATRGLDTGLALAAEAAARFDLVGLTCLSAAAPAAAAAVFSALSARDASQTTPRPRSLPEAAWHRSVAAVRTALARHSAESVSPLGIIRCLGGAEFASMTGFLLGAAALRLPVVVDGFPESVAALLARSLHADSLDAAIFAQHNGDPAHGFLLQTLGVEPHLGLGLSGAPGCGAAFTIHLLESALRLFIEIQ
jgi:nicotinate-nucleotide--dimethylbenzimidazole phosphoribosyltransferase